MTLILTGDTLEPDEVSRDLGMQPDQFWRKGESVSYGPAGRPRTSPAPWSGWKKFIDPAVAQQPLEDQLRAWLELLEPRALVLRALADAGAQVELNCFAATSEGFHLDREMVAKLFAWGVELDCTFSAAD